MLNNMTRLIYNSGTKIIIGRIDPSEGTITSTLFQVFEGTKNQVESFIAEKGLIEPPIVSLE